MDYEKTILRFKDTMRVNLNAEDFNILQNNIDNIIINKSQKEHTAGANYTVGGYNYFNKSINLIPATGLVSLPSVTTCIYTLLTFLFLQISNNVNK